MLQHCRVYDFIIEVIKILTWRVLQCISTCVRLLKMSAKDPMTLTRDVLCVMELQGLNLYLRKTSPGR